MMIINWQIWAVGSDRESYVIEGNLFKKKRTLEPNKTIIRCSIHMEYTGFLNKFLACFFSVYFVKCGLHM